GGLLDAPGVSAATPSALAAFAASIPEWRDRFAAAVRGVQPDAATRALGAVLRAAAEEQPIVIACDDAQCLDSDSIGALAAALRDLEHAPLFVVLSQLTRPLRSELDALRARLGRDIAGVAVTLSALAPAAIVELARWALPVFDAARSEEHTSELQSPYDLVCRLLLEK